MNKYSKYARRAFANLIQQNSDNQIKQNFKKDLSDEINKLSEVGSLAGYNVRALVVRVLWNTRLERFHTKEELLEFFKDEINYARILFTQLEQREVNQRNDFAQHGREAPEEGLFLETEERLPFAVDLNEEYERPSNDFTQHGEEEDLPASIYVEGEQDEDEPASIYVEGEQDEDEPAAERENPAFEEDPHPQQHALDTQETTPPTEANYDAAFHENAITTQPAGAYDRDDNGGREQNFPDLPYSEYVDEVPIVNNGTEESPCLQCIGRCLSAIL